MLINNHYLLPSSNHQSMSLWICLFLLFHINRIILLYMWFLLLTSFNWRIVFIRYCNMYQYFIYSYCWIISHCLDTHFTYPVNWWLGLLWIALLWTFMYKCLFEHLGFLRCIPRSGIAEWLGDSVWLFEESLDCILTSPLSQWPPPLPASQQYTKPQAHWTSLTV